MRSSGFQSRKSGLGSIPKRRLALSAFTVLLLSISSLAGALGLGQPTPLAKAASRSTDINFTNASAFTLQKVDESLDHGVWVQHPPDTILPGGSVHWASESNGVATGTEGRTKFFMVGAVSNPSCPVSGSPLVELHWDNP